MFSNMVCSKTVERPYGLVALISSFVAQLLWNFLHLAISIFFFVLAKAYAVESYLISSGVLRKYKAIDVEKVRYLAIVVDSQDARRTSKVIKLLKWLASIGIKRVCLYDAEGVLKKSKEVIMKKLSYVKLFEEVNEITQLDRKSLIVEFTSSSDGKEALARAANLLLMKHLKQGNLSADNKNKIFTESHMTEALQAVGCTGPEPDLLLIYGPARCHLGFPAWRLRYTEIVHMGPLSSLRYGSLLKAIYKFTFVRQNYGK